MFEKERNEDTSKSTQPWHNFGCKMGMAFPRAFALTCWRPASRLTLTTHARWAQLLCNSASKAASREKKEKKRIATLLRWSGPDTDISTFASGSHCINVSGQKKNTFSILQNHTPRHAEITCGVVIYQKIMAAVGSSFPAERSVVQIGRGTPPPARS